MADGIPLWIRQIDTTGAQDNLHGVHPTLSGDVYICGRNSTTFNVNSGAIGGIINSATIVRPATNAGFIMRYSRHGEYNFLRNISGGFAYSVQTDRADNIYLYGQLQPTTTPTNLNIGAFGGVASSLIIENPTATANSFLIKYNNLGDPQFYRPISITAEAATTGRAIATDTSLNIYVLHRVITGGPHTINLTNNAVGGTIGPAYSTSTPLGSTWSNLLVKYSEQGQPLWSRFLDGSGTDFARYVASSTTGEPIVATNFRDSPFVDLSRNAFGGQIASFPFTTIATAGQINACLVKYNPNGLPVFVRFPGNSTMTGSITRCAIYDYNNDIILTGSITGGSFQYDFNAIGGTIPAAGSSPNPLGAGNTCAFIAKYSNAGNLIWFRWLGSNDIQIASVDIENNVYVHLAYTTNSLATFDIATGAFGGDIVSFTYTRETATSISKNAIFKFTRFGQAIWVRTIFNNTSNPELFRIDHDGRTGLYASFQHVAPAGTFADLMNFSTGGTPTNLTGINYNKISDDRGGAIIKFATTTTPITGQSTDGIPQWWRTFENHDLDIGYSVATNSTNDVVLTGFYTSTSVALNTAAYGGSLGTNTSVTRPSGGQSGVIIRYNSAGVWQWVRNIRGAQPISSAMDTTGNIYVCGIYNSATAVNIYENAVAGDTTTQNVAASSSNAIFLAKYNQNGLLLFWRVIDGTFNETQLTTGRGLAIDTQNNIYITGIIESSTINLLTNAIGGTTSGPPAIMEKVGSDQAAFIIKYNADGYPAWWRFINGTATDVGCGIAVTPNGNSVYVTGRTNSSQINLATITSPIFVVQRSTNNGAFIMKYDGNGDPVWQRFLSNTQTNTGLAITLDRLENVIVCGESNETTINLQTAALGGILPPDVLITKPGSSQAGFVAKYNPDGFPLWVRWASGPDNESFTGVITDAANNVYCAGSMGSTTFAVDFTANPYTFGSTPSLTPISITRTTGRSNAGMIVKYTPDGNPLWARLIDFIGSGADFARTIAIDNANRLYIAGQITQDISNYVDLNESAIGGQTNFGFTVVKQRASTGAFLTQYNTSVVPITPPAFQSAANSYQSAFVLYNSQILNIGNGTPGFNTTTTLANVPANSRLEYLEISGIISFRSGVSAENIRFSLYQNDPTIDSNFLISGERLFNNTEVIRPTQFLTRTTNFYKGNNFVIPGNLVFATYTLDDRFGSSIDVSVTLPRITVGKYAEPTLVFRLNADLSDTTTGLIYDSSPYNTPVIAPNIRCLAEIPAPTTRSSMRFDHQTGANKTNIICNEFFRGPRYPRIDSGFSVGLWIYFTNPLNYMDIIDLELETNERMWQQYFSQGTGNYFVHVAGFIDQSSRQNARLYSNNIILSHQWINTRVVYYTNLEDTRQNVVSYYINGELTRTQTVNRELLSRNPGNLRIAVSDNVFGTAGMSTISGYISELTIRNKVEYFGNYNPLAINLEHRYNPNFLRQPGLISASAAEITFSELIIDNSANRWLYLPFDFDVSLQTTITTLSGVIQDQSEYRNRISTFQNLSVQASTFTGQSAFVRQGSGSLIFSGTSTSPATRAFLTISGTRFGDVGDRPFTIEYWFRQSNDVAINMLFDWRTATHAVQMRNYFNITDKFLRVEAPFFTNDLVFNTGIAVGVWYHVAIVRDTTQARLYVDGIQRSQTTYLDPSYNFTGNLIRLGAETVDFTTPTFNGRIDSFEITGYAKYRNTFNHRINPIFYNLDNSGAFNDYTLDNTSTPLRKYLQFNYPFESRATRFTMLWEASVPSLTVSGSLFNFFSTLNCGQPRPVPQAERIALGFYPQNSTTDPTGTMQLLHVAGGSRTGFVVDRNMRTESIIPGNMYSFAYTHDPFDRRHGLRIYTPDRDMICELSGAILPNFNQIHAFTFGMGAEDGTRADQAQSLRLRNLHWYDGIMTDNQIRNQLRLIRPRFRIWREFRSMDYNAYLGYAAPEIHEFNIVGGRIQPLAHWPLQYVNGGHEISLANFGEVFTQPDQLNGRFLSDTSFGSFVQLPNLRHEDLLTNFTFLIRFRFRIGENGLAWQRVFDFNVGNSTQFFFLGQNSTSTGLRFGVKRNNLTEAASNFGVFSPNFDYIAAVIYDTSFPQNNDNRLRLRMYRIETNNTATFLQEIPRPSTVGNNDFSTYTVPFTNFRLGQSAFAPDNLLNGQYFDFMWFRTAINNTDLARICDFIAANRLSPTGYLATSQLTPEITGMNDAASIIPTNRSGFTDSHPIVLRNQREFYFAMTDVELRENVSWYGSRGVFAAPRRFWTLDTDINLSGITIDNAFFGPASAIRSSNSWPIRATFDGRHHIAANFRTRFVPRLEDLSNTNNFALFPSVFDADFSRFGLSNVGISTNRPHISQNTAVICGNVGIANADTLRSFSTRFNDITLVDCSAQQLATPGGANQHVGVLLGYGTTLTSNILVANVGLINPGATTTGRAAGIIAGGIRGQIKLENVYMAEATATATILQGSNRGVIVGIDDN